MVCWPQAHLHCNRLAFPEGNSVMVAFCGCAVLRSFMLSLFFNKTKPGFPLDKLALSSTGISWSSRTCCCCCWMYKKTVDGQDKPFVTIRIARSAYIFDSMTKVDMKDFMHEG